MASFQTLLGLGKSGIALAQSGEGATTTRQRRIGAACEEFVPRQWRGYERTLVEAFSVNLCLLSASAVRGT